MSVSLPKVDAALALCGKHLDETNSRNGQIEQILVGYTLTLIHSEWEQWFVAKMKSRADGHADVHLAAFTRYAVGRIARKFKISDLAGYLGSFDPACKAAFLSQVEGPAQAAYDTIEANRQALAHNSSVGMTFTDVERTYASAIAVLEAFDQALMLGSATSAATPMPTRSTGASASVPPSWSTPASPPRPGKPGKRSVIDRILHPRR